MDLTFRQLKVLVEVARLGSAVRASEDLHLTPPAVSLQIKAVERASGHVLFDRASKRMTLTAGGEFFSLSPQSRRAGSVEPASSS